LVVYGPATGISVEIRQCSPHTITYGTDEFIT